MALKRFDHYDLIMQKLWLEQQVKWSSTNTLITIPTTQPSVTTETAQMPSIFYLDKEPKWPFMLHKHQLPSFNIQMTQIAITDQSSVEPFLIHTTQVLLCRNRKVWLEQLLWSSRYGAVRRGTAALGAGADVPRPAGRGRGQLCLGEAGGWRCDCGGECGGIEPWYNSAQTDFTGVTWAHDALRSISYREACAGRWCVSRQRLLPQGYWCYWAVAFGHKSGCRAELPARTVLDDAEWAKHFLLK